MFKSNHQPCIMYLYAKFKDEISDNNKIIYELINVLDILCGGHLHGENAVQYISNSCFCFND